MKTRTFWFAICAALMALVAIPPNVSEASRGAAPVRASALASVLAEPTPLPDAKPTPIKHVVVIYQENQTFDTMLGTVCQQRATPCDGYTGPVTLANGVTVQNPTEPEIVPFVSHSPSAQASGLSGNWDQIHGCKPSDNYACITHADPSQIPNLKSLADSYAVSDATFAAGGYSSFTAHVELADGTTDGFYGVNPVPSKTHVALGKGWGCPSNRDALWGVGFEQTLTFEPSCIPLPDGSGAYRPTQVPYAKTIMEQLEDAGRTWHIYDGIPGRPATGFLWNFCSYFSWCQQTRSGNVTVYSSFITAANNGTLPNVSLIPATSKWSQHNGTSLAVGDNYVGSLVDAAMSGPDWASTAVFITYDDCGCFYDHVSPPDGLGLRNPMVIVSPWAKPGSTDSTVAEQPYSMLAFIDHNFGMPALTPLVGGSYDYKDSFDYASPPSTVTPEMVHTPIPEHTRQLVNSHADEWRNDPA